MAILHREFVNAHNISDDFLFPITDWCFSDTSQTLFFFPSLNQINVFYYPTYVWSGRLLVTAACVQSPFWVHTM